tara:strand:- start:772 stop:1068 length:297 start_codon:yes stop_codon:yes gene_type:complete
MPSEIDNRTVFERVEQKYGMSFIEFVEECRDEKGMSLEDICQLIGCGVNNIRRIFKQTEFKFHLPPKEMMLSQTNLFNKKSINIGNILSRQWIGTLKI